MPTTTTPTPLGRLEVLPGELRNAIYALVITSKYDVEADYHQPCRQYQSLHFVSKKIHTETKALINEVSTHQDCEHINYKVTLPTLTEMPRKEHHLKLLDSIAARVAGRPHRIAQAATLRFLTGHLGKDVPLAVVCHLKLPNGSTFSIHGASAARHEQVSNEVKCTLRGLELRAMAGSSVEFRGGAGSKMKRPEFRKGDFMGLAERVRDAVCGAVKPDLGDLEAQETKGCFGTLASDFQGHGRQSFRFV